MKAIAEVRTTDLDHDNQTTAVEAARAVFAGLDLTHETRAMATEVEGEVDEILDAISQIHVQLHAAGHGRLSTTLTIETRGDSSVSLEDRG